ncbi:hypothetical protein JCM14202_2589 [Agrilactobacillus composti DSM 18527 = JCM 14202]|nr:hypothetical protein JCM14202_2589 [Agrilactobacillus composti DSM 18527 = JCM 14202]
MSASVVLVAFQTVYYVERTTWHWNIGAVELISGVLYVALAAGLMVLISRWQVRWTFLGLALFQGLALWLLRQFPNFIRQDQHPLTRAGSRSNNDIELFVWLTLLVLGLRDVRQFANQLALLFLGIVLLGFFAFLARILFKNQVKIHFPWWHILASFLNGATETFAMLYILFVADPDNKWAIPLGYLYYALGFLAGQVLRKPLQKWLKPLSDLTLQLLGFTLGSWLLVSHFTLPLGLFIIGFVGTANSILLNHAAFQLPIGAQQNRLMVKYRNVYLGSILAQFLMLLTLGITALALQGHFLAPLTTVHRLATTNNQAAVLIMGCILALIITLDALAVFLVAPKVDEQPLYK